LSTSGTSKNKKLQGNRKGCSTTDTTKKKTRGNGGGETETDETGRARKAFDAAVVRKETPTQ